MLATLSSDDTSESTFLLTAKGRLFLSFTRGTQLPENMKLPSCTLSAQQAGEDLIGTAGHYQTYVLIECPLPWPVKAFDSQHIPPALRQYVKAVKAERSVRFLCIHRGSASVSVQTAVLIYERINRPALKSFSEEVASGYEGREFQLDSLDQVVACLETYWQSDRAAFPENCQGQLIDQQDIFICTHGMRDKCCAQFGQPLFRAAQRSVAQGELPARVWKVSHIGGHRFAPTAISLPDGRYYGRLTLTALKAIATRSGPIAQLRSVYRGWGLLPQPLQVLEQQLLLAHGWQWLTYEVAYKLVALDGENDQMRAELLACKAPAMFQRSGYGFTLSKSSALAEQSSPPDRQAIWYRARIVKDAAQTYCVTASCGDAAPSTFVKYAVADSSMADRINIQL